MLVPSRNWTLSPSDFAFLWEECRRCFYLKVVNNFRRPKSPMPRIFTAIDSEMKMRYGGLRTAEAMPFLPPGVIDASVSWVESRPLPVPRHSSLVSLRGKLDTLVRFDDETYGVIDFKTSGVRDQHVGLYTRQLHAYALALENASPGNLSLSPVSKLGLVIFEPAVFSGGGDAPGCLTGPVSWKEIPRSNAAFLAFLADVVDLLEMPVPPEPSPACQWCQYRDRSRSSGL
jgi:PD-(D/E)XK nuclease superfamily protein